MSTIHKITSDNLPVFPCWLWTITQTEWWRYTGAPYLADGYSHWSPDAPTPPAERPDGIPPEGRTGGLLAEMQERYAQEEDAKAVTERPTLGGDDNPYRATVAAHNTAGYQPPVIPSDPASRAAPNNEAPPSEAAEALLEEMTNAFLRYPLPESVCADLCATMHGYKGRVGTNLLSYTEAKDMLRAVVQPARIIDRAFDAERKAHEQEVARWKGVADDLHTTIHEVDLLRDIELKEIDNLRAQLTASTDQYRQLVKEKIDLELELTALEQSILDLSHPNMKTLLADVAYLRAEIERWRDSNIRLRDECEHQAGRALKAELDRDVAKSERDGLRADGERLDWLEANAEKGHYFKAESHNKNIQMEVRFWGRLPDGTPLGDPTGTVRAAIDAARTPAQPS